MGRQASNSGWGRPTGPPGGHRPSSELTQRIRGISTLDPAELELLRGAAARLRGSGRYFSELTLRLYPVLNEEGRVAAMLLLANILKNSVAHEVEKP